jgi:hypothetical protein
MTENLDSAIAGPLASPPHFLMMFAATAFVLDRFALDPLDTLPSLEEVPERPPPPSSQDEWEEVADALTDLGQIIEHDEPGPDDPEERTFWAASRAATPAIASRRTRFPFYVDCFRV